MNEFFPSAVAHAFFRTLLNLNQKIVARSDEQREDLEGAGAEISRFRVADRTHGKDRREATPMQRDADFLHHIIKRLRASA
jgi:hypothetical protein